MNVAKIRGLTSIVVFYRLLYFTYLWPHHVSKLIDSYQSMTKQNVITKVYKRFLMKKRVCERFVIYYSTSITSMNRTLV